MPQRERPPSEKLSRRPERLHLVCEFCVMQKRDALCASVNVAARAQHGADRAKKRSASINHSYRWYCVTRAHQIEWNFETCVYVALSICCCWGRTQNDVCQHTACSRMIWYWDRTLTGDKEKFSLWWGLNNATGGMNSPSRFHVLIKLLAA